MNETVAPSPVTVVVSRRVRKGCTEEFERLSAKMTETAAGFAGHLGAVLFRPFSSDDPEYRVAFKFDTEEHLEAWLNSEERASWLKSIEDLLEQPSAIEKAEGLVPWFTLPGKTIVRPPAKHKMAVVSWLGLFPIVTAIFWLFGAPLAHLPLVPRTFIVTAIVMGLMTYVVMPRLTKAFAFWLFPKPETDVR